MSLDPERKSLIGSTVIEEIYWAGGWAVYVNSRLAAVSYDEAKRLTQAGEPVPLKS